MISGIILLIAMIFLSSFFSLAEISLSSSRKVKLQVLIDEGNKKAEKVLALQENPGRFFTTVQVGVNIAAIVSGIMSDEIVAHYFSLLFSHFSLSEGTISFLSNFVSFVLITSLVIEISDLIPRRIAIVYPEKIAMAVYYPMHIISKILLPLIVIYDGIANVVLSFFRIPLKREENITHEDIFAVMDAGAQAGVVDKKEHHLIENVFELESRWVPSAMTQRDDIIYFTFQESEKSIRQKIANNPHSKFLVCDNDLDSIVGYIASKDILPALIHENNIDLAENIRKHYCKSLLIIPNTLTLSEALDKFNETNEDFAIILNEYALVVGLITLEDVMTTLMGDVVSPFQEELIIKRAEDSWLIDGTTPIEDVVRVLEIDSFPEQDSYETLAGFIMYVLKSIPKKAEKVEYDNYIFEIMDVDNYKIDQVLVTKKKDNNS